MNLGFDVWQLFALVSIRDRALLWLAYVEEADHPLPADTAVVVAGQERLVVRRARHEVGMTIRPTVVTSSPDR